jgi:CubicO group peptidase (beta-lactamase class C family)
MNYINAIGIFLLIALVSSCKNNEKEVLNKNSSEKIEAIEEVTNPRIEGFINKMIDEEHFKGVVLAAVNNDVIHAQGYGMANDTVKNNFNTKFHVASITKQFTAAAIMQLVEQNKINLEESINNFLPDQYRSNKWDIVTVHHLLSHTSGIEDYAVVRDYYDVEKGFCLGNTVDGMIKEAMSKELDFQPGSQFSYSNIGFTLLGKIIENTTGEPYRNYLKDHVLEPMGMHSSFIHTTNYTASEDEAIGYRWDDELNKHVLDDIVSLPVTEPDGNLVTTLNDFLKWTDIYMENDQEILQKESIAKLMTPNISTNKEDENDTSSMYGYGLFISKETISHSGYIVGFRSHFIVKPQENIRVFVFNNNVSNNPKNISEGIYRILTENENSKNDL